MFPLAYNYCRDKSDTFLNNPFKASASYWTFEYENAIEFIWSTFTVQGNMSKHDHLEDTKNKEWIIVSNS